MCHKTTLKILFYFHFKTHAVGQHGFLCVRVYLFIYLYRKFRFGFDVCLVGALLENCHRIDPNVCLCVDFVIWFALFDNHMTFFSSSSSLHFDICWQ